VIRVAGADDSPTTARQAGDTFFARQEHFATTTSTNDVVAAWLAAGEPEVVLATADEQTGGRGRDGRTWQAKPGDALLLSLGFRPTWLDPDRVWQLAAVIALAMADAAEESAGLADGAIRLKWPNDLVIEFEHADTNRHRLAKLAGVLGETSGLGTDDPRAVVGIGINADWRREDFPADLAATMTSLRDASGGRPIDRVELLDGFLGRIEMRVEGLRKGHFALSDWQERQITTGRDVHLLLPDGGRRAVRAVGVDGHSGGLIVDEDGRDRVVHTGEIVHVRLPDQQNPEDL
jgi:BirA family biotin operon repressor/biotin-[acetyl-CoA-carboxylase] ligase